jgi:hypothetical protein
LIIVDDCGPIPAQTVLENRDLPFQTRLFRIEQDVRWNWLAARNIGAHEAESGWISITDMDHVYTPEVAERLVRGYHRPDWIYRYSRQEHDGTHIHPHPNSWLFTKDMYWKIGGHDEALSGYYGTDGEYRSRASETAPIRILTERLVRFERIGDSSTTNYKRKQPEDAAVKKLIRQRKPGWKPKTLSFPYKEIVL